MAFVDDAMGLQGGGEAGERATESAWALGPASGSALRSDAVEQLAGCPLPGSPAADKADDRLGDRIGFPPVECLPVGTARGVGSSSHTRPTLRGQRRASPVNSGQAAPGPALVKCAGQRGFAHVGSVGLAGIEPATSPLSGLAAVAASALVRRMDTPSPDAWSHDRPTLGSMGSPCALPVTEQARGAVTGPELRNRELDGYHQRSPQGQSLALRNGGSLANGYTRSFRRA